MNWSRTSSLYLRLLRDIFGFLLFSGVCLGAEGVVDRADQRGIVGRNLRVSDRRVVDLEFRDRGLRERCRGPVYSSRAPRDHRQGMIPASTESKISSASQVAVNRSGLGDSCWWPRSEKHKVDRSA